MNQNISHCYLTPFRVLFGHEHFMCMTIYTLTILHQVYFSYIRAAYSKSFFYSVYYTLSIRYTSSSLEATRQDTNEILLSEYLSLSLSLSLEILKKNLVRHSKFFFHETWWSTS